MTLGDHRNLLSRGEKGGLARQNIEVLYNRGQGWLGEQEHFLTQQPISAILGREGLEEKGRGQTHN